MTFDGRPVRILANDKLSLAIRTVGGAMVQLLMKDYAEPLNPFEGLGHFVCVDGFGPVSKEEQAAGLPGHGEAHRVPWDVLSSDKQNGALTVEFAAALPIVHENFRRKITMVDGENVVYIDSELESLLGFDRPINWGEHATIGGPFLEQGKTVTDMYDDYFASKTVRIRIGTSFTRSREDRFSNLDQSSPENTSLYNSDGVLTFSTGAFAPGVTVDQATYKMWAVDGGIKWNGLAVNGQYFMSLHRHRRQADE